MSGAPSSLQARFKPQNSAAAHEEAADLTQTALSEEPKRRGHVIQLHDDEAGSGLRDGPAKPPAAAGLLKRKRKAAVTLSFGDDEGDEASEKEVSTAAIKPKLSKVNPSRLTGDDEDPVSATKKLGANASITVTPRALTKAAVKRQVAEREALRTEFLALQAAVKATEIAIPFVFYDGSDTAGGTVRVKKGDPIWIFLDKTRKLAAELGVGSDKVANAQRQWARVGVDDLLLVRGTMIIPHHHDFYFFIMNKSLGPKNTPLFAYSADAPKSTSKGPELQGLLSAGAIAASAAAAEIELSLLEGAYDDPRATKVVDRRWYEKNKHIFPASTWQEFDPEKDYQAEVSRDTGGNAFFFSGSRA